MSPLKKTEAEVIYSYVKISEHESVWRHGRKLHTFSIFIASML
jgi:hypothetical protein